jgi:hypothetical protein
LCFWGFFFFFNPTLLFSYFVKWKAAMATTHSPREPRHHRAVPSRDLRESNRAHQRLYKVQFIWGFLKHDNFGLCRNLRLVLGMMQSVTLIKVFNWLNFKW